MVSASVLTLLSCIGENYVIYSDTSRKCLNCALTQEGKIITYAFRQLKPYEQNYLTYDLEINYGCFGIKNMEVLLV